MAVVYVVTIELATIAMESAYDSRHAKNAVHTAYPIDGPLPLLYVEGPYCHTRPAFGRHVHLVDGDQAVEVGLHAECGRERFPGLAAVFCGLQAVLHGGPRAREVF